MLQVAVRLRPLNAREVAQGETEAVTVSHEDPHSLEVRAVDPHMLLPATICVPHALSVQGCCTQVRIARAGGMGQHSRPP